MLFNSPIFIFGFLPLTLALFFLAARLSRGAAIGTLALASIVFYAWWDVRWLPLLLGSIAFNLTVARRIAAELRVGSNAKLFMLMGVAGDLALLAYYKYSHFVLSNAAELFGISWSGVSPELPLGISFFTFTQIAFLIDVWVGKAADFDLVRYVLFVTYYPHLIAGPILHHKEMMPQFRREDIFAFRPERLADGASIFILGLFKKAVLADQFGRFAAVGFNAATAHPIGLYESWGAALSYTMQLYFDFSGYSDMAIGLALMIGIVLPANFQAPYKSLSIIDFWRRWHMTLSRFLRDYLYLPLGGNRRGVFRRYLNLAVTMVLGGLWHGAGWTFVVWGALHGAFLIVNHLWRAVRPGESTLPALVRSPLKAASWCLTFGCVVVGWVFFRSHDLSSAATMLCGMAGLQGAQLPEQVIALMPVLRSIATTSGTVAFLADGTVLGLAEMIVLLILGFVLVLMAPTMSELSVRNRCILVVPCAALAFQQVVFGSSSEFLYFQF